MNSTYQKIACTVLPVGFLILFISFQPWQNANVVTRTKETRSLALGDNVRKELKCLTFEEDVNRRISEAKQVFVTMPAKAGGSSLKRFGKRCNKSEFDDNFINDDYKVKDFMSWSMDLPKVVVAHSYLDETIIRLAQTTPNDVLTIFIYREESERKVSSIKHVVQSRFCDGLGMPGFDHVKDYVHVKKNETHCVIEDEAELMKNIIERPLWEVGYDTDVILSCELYDAIDDNNPNILMVNYKHVDELQGVLAKHHCPEIQHLLPLHDNVASQKNNWAYIKTRETGEEVPLAEWAKSKQQLWSWAFDSREKIGKFCKGKTRKLEKEMFRCEDQVADLRRRE